MDRNDGGSVDRISPLHDDLLKRVLSFLPIKYAVRTSVLSKKWKEKWLPSADCLDFTYLPGGFGSRWCEDSERNRNCFRLYVDRVLSHHAESVIKKCTFRGSDSYPYQSLDGWIAKVMACKVQELYVSFFFAKLGKELYPDLFRCSTLEVLKISGDLNLTLDPPLGVSLPKLQTLSLRGVSYRNDAAMQRIFSGCSSLEVLEIERNCSHDGVYNAIISMPSLKRLAIYGCYARFINEEQQYRLEINAPSLQSLLLLDDMSQEILICDFYVTFVGACIDGCCAPMILSQISDIRKLSLLDCALQSLMYSPNFVLPIFSDLTSLRLELNALTCHHFLFNFLKNSPELRFLCISWTVIGCNGYFAVGPWRPPLPDLELEKLKRIEFHNCHGTSFERSVVQYLLKHATSLDQMIIFWRSFGCETSFRRQMENARYEILHYQKASSTCLVQFRAEPQEQDSFSLV